MTDYAEVLLRSLQQRLIDDAWRAGTREEQVRLGTYYADIQRALDGEQEHPLE